MTDQTLSSAASSPPFVDRRQNNGVATAGFERRQFANSHDDLTPDARELAQAVDEYKLLHRRRYITFEELLGVIHELGYQKSVTV